MTRARRPARTVEQIVELYENAEQCAVAAGLRYVSPNEPGIRRLRRGQYFSYRDPAGNAVADAVRLRIKALAVPPAWRDVWICAADDGHLLAVGEDERGRRQYLYHERWRSYRDELNFYRLIDFGARLPTVRADVRAQLRRRTLDHALVLATMLRIVDVCGLRVGSEEYADENDSYGLSTLTKRHVTVGRGAVEFCFPAKSGQQARVRLNDPAVARVLTQLMAQRGRRLFTVDGSAVSADEVNARLSELAGSRVSAKDFRTWHGTRVAFGYLREHVPPGDDASQRVLEAVDLASEFLGNTRAVARAHYVHPHVIAAYEQGTFGDLLASRRPARTAGLDRDEKALLPFLQTLLARVLPAT